MMTEAPEIQHTNSNIVRTTTDKRFVTQPQSRLLKYRFIRFRAAPECFEHDEHEFHGFISAHHIPQAVGSNNNEAILRPQHALPNMRPP